MGSISLFKRIAAYFFFATIPWAIVFLGIQAMTALIISVISMGVHALCAACITNNNASILKTVFMLVPSVDLVLYHSLLGSEAMVGYVFLPLVVLPFLLYSQFSVVMFSNITIPIVAYVCMMIFPLSGDIQPIQAPLISKIFPYGTFLTAALILFAMFYYWTKRVVELKSVENKLLTFEMKVIKETTVRCSYKISNHLNAITTSAYLISKANPSPNTKNYIYQIEDHGQKITELLKKLSNIQTIKRKQHTEDIQMIDLDNYVFHDE